MLHSKILDKTRRHGSFETFNLVRVRDGYLSTRDGIPNSPRVPVSQPTPVFTTSWLC